MSDCCAAPAHKWNIDANDVGTCEYCGEIVDFGAMRRAKYKNGNLYASGRSRGARKPGELSTEAKFYAASSLDMLVAQQQAGYKGERRSFRRR